MVTEISMHACFENLHKVQGGQERLQPDLVGLQNGDTG